MTALEVSLRPRIKICGITNAEDVRLAVAAGADALGFICVPESPRFVADPAALSALIKLVPPLVATVAVCRDARTAPGCIELFSAIQVYGDDGIETVPDSVRVIRAFRIRDDASLDEIERSIAAHRPSALLLDAYSPDRLGGSGLAFDWRLASLACERFDLPVILAGGLTPDNVAEAISAVRPYAVDVSSGIESAPGIKDPEKLRSFVQTVMEEGPEVR
jgi:phosphoribosylanthranilate isomerase